MGGGNLGDGGWWPVGGRYVVAGERTTRLRVDRAAIWRGLETFPIYAVATNNTQQIHAFALRLSAYLLPT